MAIERETNEQNLEHDMLLEDAYEEELELETSLEAELHQMVGFKEDAEDDEKLQSFTLSPVPARLLQEYKSYADYRMEPLNRMRCARDRSVRPFLLCADSLPTHTATARASSRSPPRTTRASALASSAGSKCRTTSVPRVSASGPRSGRRCCATTAA